MRFSNSVTRVGFQTVLSITQEMFLYKKLDSFLSYQLVEADLLKCKPALGDRIKVRFYENEKTLCAYIISQQHQTNLKSLYNPKLRENIYHTIN